MRQLEVYMRSGRWSRMAVIVTSVIMLVTAAACSSSGGAHSASSGSSATGDGAGSTAAASTAAHANGTPIKLGLGVAETGFGSALSANVTKVVAAWAKWANSEGGIGGHPVSIVSGDTAGTPSTALGVLTKMIEEDHVQAVLLEDPSVEAAVGGYLASTGVPVIGATGFSGDPWNKYPNFFAQWVTSPLSEDAFSFASAKVAGAKKVGVVVCAEVAICLRTSDAAKEASAKLGFTYEGVVQAAASAPDYTAQCLSLIQEGVDNIQLAITSDVMSRLVPECMQQGYMGTWSTTGAGFVPSALKPATGSHWDNVMDGFPWWVDAVPVRQYRDVMTQYGDNVDYASPYATTTWTSLRLFQTALGPIAHAASISSAGILRAYDQIKGQTLGGLLPEPVTYTAGKPSPTLHCYWAYDAVVGQTPTTKQVGRNGNNGTAGLASSCNDE